jgi:murein DD-endopeptidase MepM/ murein hydrolase activator NlpD
MFTGPFGWKMRNHNDLKIIAAAPNQILFKQDGDFDRSSNFNNNVWYGIYVQNNDERISWYGHMKNGSTNTKNAGNMISEGDYLGLVCSSGKATGPFIF